MLALALTTVLATDCLRAAPAATNSASAGNNSTSLTVVVTARKWAEPLQEVPGAVTVRSAGDLAAAGAKDLRDAVCGVPDLTLADFTVRRLTFPYVRGIGSGQNAPAVATYIDGVPQLSYITANQELLDVDRIEFLRGPQGALYGSASLGGVCNIVPHIPSPEPGGFITLSAGDYGAFGARGGAEGPLDSSGVLGSVSAGYSTREGYAKNDYTGGDIDSREDWFGRAQLYLPNQGLWDFRLSVTAEQDRDGDYALYDLDRIRAKPHHVDQNYTGCNDRDIVQPVFTAQRHGDDVDVTSITAFQWWHTRDSTDLDYTPADYLRGSGEETSHAWIQELRLASPADAPVQLSDRVAMHWLVGVFAFDSRSESSGVSDTMYLPPYPLRQEHDANLDNAGLGLFGQTTFTLDKRWELGLGLRDDVEHRSADFSSFTPPGPSVSSSPDHTFNQVTPRASLSYHLTPDMLAYLQVAEGYKAGGFNKEGPASYNPETSWNYEAGLKTMWFDRSLTANAAIFRTLWHDMQVDVPAPGADPFSHAYCIENAGRARSQGAELELSARPWRDLELFAGGALLDADFRPGSQTMGFGPPPFYPLSNADIGGNDLPFAPRATWNAGAEFTHDLTEHLRGFIRTEVSGTTRYCFDPNNSVSQGAFALVNVSAGVSAGNWRVEARVKNLFDRNYVALALPNPGYSPSGYIGENGAPRTAEVSLTRYF